MAARNRNNKNYTLMGKNKLRKFAEMENLSMVFQYPYGVLRDKGFAMRGHWHEEFSATAIP